MHAACSHWPVAVPSHASDRPSPSCRRGETVVVSDLRTDPRFADAERARLLAAEIAAFVEVPLIKEGQWVAMFGVHSATPRTWTRDQIELVEVIAERIWAPTRARARRKRWVDR